MGKILIPFVFAGFFLSGCGSTPAKPNLNQSIDVARILTQVNDAVEASIDHNDKDFPPITSVTLDLEVTVTTTFDGTLPIQLLTAGVSTSDQKLHHITLTFVPKADAEPSAKQPPKTPTKLAAAIRAVYQSVAHAGTSYKFQNGSIVLQCALKAEADAGIKGIGLVPIQIDASDTSQSVQSITLNFGEKLPTITKPPTTPAPTS